MSAEKTITFKRAGDVELWSVQGADWSLPVLAYPKNVEGDDRLFYWVEPSIPMSTPQVDKINNAFAPFKMNSEPGFNVVSSRDLQSAATKCSGITPDYYLKWPGLDNVDRQTEDRVVEMDEPDAIPREMERFLKYFARSSGMVQYPVLKVVWREFMRVGLEWMLIKREPIHLGFCKLIPIPYRTNWKEILFSRFRSIGSLFRHKSKDVQETALDAIGFTREMGNVMLCSVAGHNIARWKIEVIPDKMWDENSDRIERQRVSSMGAEGYLRGWLKTVWKLRHEIIEVMRLYSREVTKPCGRLGKGRSFGCQVLLPHIEQGRVRPKSDVDYDVFVVVPDPFTKAQQREMDDPTTLVFEDESVLSVPAVRKALEDLRHDRGDVEQQGNGEAGAVGVLVPDVVQEPAGRD